MAEQRPVKPRVAGSIPALGAVSAPHPLGRVISACLSAVCRLGIVCASCRGAAFRLRVGGAPWTMFSGCVDAPGLRRTSDGHFVDAGCLVSSGHFAVYWVPYVDHVDGGNLPTFLSRGTSDVGDAVHIRHTAGSSGPRDRAQADTHRRRRSPSCGH